MHPSLDNAQRWQRNGHKGALVWLTGLSGAGKSTLSKQLERELFDRGFHVFVLDGDVVRQGLNSDLGFLPEDRSENIRRAAEAGCLLASAGNITLVAFISPYRRDRRRAREVAAAAGCEFIEVFLDAPLEVCEQRDCKGLYRRARAGELADFTGVSAPYEIPEHPEVRVRTGELSVEACVETMLAFLLPRVQLK